MIKAVYPAQSQDDDEDDGAPPIPAGSQELHYARRLPAPQGRGAAPARQGAPRPGQGRRLGRIERRPLRERRLHLRQAAPARDRPPHPLSHQAHGSRRGHRPDRARGDRPGLLRCDGHGRWTRTAREATYTIVGIDEADVARGRLSWISPLARALLKRREGDEVTFKAPGGDQVLEIVSVEYKELG